VANPILETCIPRYYELGKQALKFSKIFDAIFCQNLKLVKKTQLKIQHDKAQRSFLQWALTD
tara:strand:+ start:8680 stop:8865 length:186 start_codon:yes stop_codon:yes gene_type:complete